MDDTNPAAVTAFIARWQNAGGSELANYQLFLGELIDLLALPKPEPATGQAEHDAYVFERAITFSHGDGHTSPGRIDLYRRGAFICEAKRVKLGAHTKGFDEALLKARSQAEGYARAIPATEGRPPFLLVVDVGHVIELYSEFSRSGGTYTPFPDPASHRIKLAELEKPEIRNRLRHIWLDADALDPAKVSAKVTKAIAADLAQLAKSLEAAGHAPEAVARFLTRALFTMFAEDVGLLPENAFRSLLADCGKTPESFLPLVGELWRSMDTGGFSAALRVSVLHFNGKLFHEADVLPLDAAQIGLLHRAAEHDWKFVEPAIFGTLLERALNPEERHALGAHYTPRAYVERLVLPTVIVPLRGQWVDVRAGALTLATEGDAKAAQALVRGFHQQLCAIRVLDPACGSGNFLYVTLEHMKRLEGEVLNQLAELGDTQSLLDLAGVSVDPHRFLGLELNPRAASLAELVLWIGHLQWHYRTRGHVNPPQPVLRDFRNIECRDAVLAYDSKQLVLDESGNPVTRWDGKTKKLSPITGEEIPDESAQVPQYRYLNPVPAQWPDADYIVGNPPFIGASTMRGALGDGYVEALRAAWPDVPDSSDFVMHWWQRAAELTLAGKLKRFGLITTNSLPQTFNRRVVADAMGKGLSLAFAIPDHPWVDTAGDANVRIAMTVGVSIASANGVLLNSTRELSVGDGAYDVEFTTSRGLIHQDLRIGANVASARTLRANERIANRGVQTLAKGFVIKAVDLEKVDPTKLIARPYLNGRDLTEKSRNVWVLDTYSLSEIELSSKAPKVYQWLLNRAKPGRDQNPRDTYKQNWWLLGENQPLMRESIKELNRFIATPITAKHRTFQFIDVSTLSDQALMVIATENTYPLGVLSSNIHLTWALASGGRLGVGNDPRYTKARCFETFPFPAFGPPTKFNQPLDSFGRESEKSSYLDDSWRIACRIEQLGEDIDAHRKRQQRDFPKLTLTGIYNVLEKLRSGEVLNAKEKTIHEQGLVSVLKQYHDELDIAVLAAYGWSDLIALQQIVNGNATPQSAGYVNRDTAAQALTDLLLERLVALNTERVAEESKGTVRWLRPEFQNPERTSAQHQTEIDTQTEDDEPLAESVPATAKAMPWPKDPAEQARAVADALSPQPQSLEQIAVRFSGKGPWKKRLPGLLQMLVALGRAREEGSGFVAG